MDNVLKKKDIVKEIWKKILNKKGITARSRFYYKRKYSQEVIEVVLNEFLDVLVDVIEDGDSVDIRGYLKIEPRYCKQWSGNDFDGNEIYAPPRYKPKATLKSKFEDACKRLSERELYDYL